MSGWGCPHEVKGECRRVKGLACNPGMKGCVLFGRFVWSTEEKNRPPRPARPGTAKPSEPTSPDKSEP